MNYKLYGMALLYGLIGALLAFLIIKILMLALGPLNPIAVANTKIFPYLGTAMEVLLIAFGFVFNALTVFEYYPLQVVEEKEN